MRIAILTMPLRTNFGGILQCYALQTVLERMGHNVSVLNTDLHNVDLVTRTELFLKRLIKTILRKESKFYGWKTEKEIIRQHTQAFIDKNIHLRDISDLSFLEEGEYDAIVVGSDQIWRPLYYQPIANAYLKFAQNWNSVKKVAYAASFGVDKWEYTQQEADECASLLRSFDAISVRENSAIGLCKKHLGAEAVQVLDPTMLLSKDDYIKLVGELTVEKHKGELFCYFLDMTPEKVGLANRLAAENGWKIFQANNFNVDCLTLSFEERIQKPVEEWIAGFRDAAFVVTDSFHGCVFSIIFNKPFFAIGNMERGFARFNSLLSLFDLQDRLHESTNRLITLDRTDYAAVNIKLKSLRHKSLSFLESALA